MFLLISSDKLKERAGASLTIFIALYRYKPSNNFCFSLIFADFSLFFIDQLFYNSVVQRRFAIMFTVCKVLKIQYCQITILRRTVNCIIILMIALYIPLVENNTIANFNCSLCLDASILTSASSYTFALDLTLKLQWVPQPHFPFQFLITHTLSSACRLITSHSLSICQCKKLAWLWKTKEWIR